MLSLFFAICIIFCGPTPTPTPLVEPRAYCEPNYPGDPPIYRCRQIYP